MILKLKFPNLYSALAQGYRNKYNLIGYEPKKELWTFMFCTRKLLKFVDSVYRIDKKFFKYATITEIAVVINQYNYTRFYSLAEVFWFIDL